jgi:hypothetical protein
MELRPLGFGEIFDRAVTLYIRNFWPFAAIVAVLIVPLAILQYLVDLSSQPELDAMLRILLHPKLGPNPPIPAIFNSPSDVAVLVVLLFVTYAVWPFALNAVAVGVARLYRGLPVEFRTCYEVVLRRWLQILGMIALDFMVFFGWYTAVLIVILLFTFVIAFFVAAAPGAAFAFGVIFGLIGFFALLPSLAPLLVALSFSMYAVVIEERPVIESLVLGFSRVFNRDEFWRSLLFALAVFAVMLAGSTIFGFIGLVAAYAHLPLLQALIESLARAVITPFAVVLLAIYYFDVRIRREAFDLETSLERLTAAQPA